MIYFRADSNPVIASGHIMRCLSIARNFIKHGLGVTFLVADENPIEVLNNAGVKYICLNSKWNDLSYEIKKVKEILTQTPSSLLFIDTYSVTEDYVSALSVFAKIVYLGSKRIVLKEASMIINYSSVIDKDFYNSSYSGCKTSLLLDVKYAPLRTEFQKVDNHAKNKIKRVLIIIGNTDPNNFTGSLIEGIITSSLFDDIYFDVVVGRMFSHKKVLFESYKEKTNIILHENVTDMASLMRNCEVAVSANGTSVYELIAAKVAVLSFSMVPEQKESAEGLSSINAVEYCGEFYSSPKCTIECIIERLNEFKSKPELYLDQIDNAATIVDGNGCEHIYNELIVNNIL